jgi:SAM-dependent methyltransferase
MPAATSGEMVRRWIFIERCVACGSRLDNTDRTFDLTDHWSITEDRFHVTCCDKCKTWLLNPRPAPEEMPRFYQNDFLYASPPGRGSFVTRAASRVQSWNLASEVNWVCRELVKGGSYLDYSAGNGQILAAVAQRRPDASVSATEYSEAFRPVIQQRCPYSIVYPDLDSLPACQRFDVISAFGVLEHVEDPVELLRAFRARLTPAGTLLVSIPNPGSVQARVFGRRWYSWLAPRHFQLMPRRTFLDFARGANLQVTDEHHFFLRSAPSTLVLSMFPTLDPLVQPTKAKLMAYAALFAAFLPLEFAFAAVKASGFMGFALKNLAEKSTPGGNKNGGGAA